MLPTPLNRNYDIFCFYLKHEYLSTSFDICMKILDRIYNIEYPFLASILMGKGAGETTGTQDLSTGGVEVPIFFLQLKSLFRYMRYSLPLRVAKSECLLLRFTPKRSLTCWVCGRTNLPPLPNHASIPVS